MSQFIVFWIAAPLALGSAIGMLVSRKAVHSALLLVVTLISVAVLFIDLDAEFLGVVQIVVYAGAILVLFLFVIMLLGVERHEVLDEHLPGQRGAAILLGVLLAAGIVFVVRHAFSGSSFAGLEQQNATGNVQAVGRLLFSRYLWPFEVTSALLLVAAIGAMLLGRREDIEDELDAPDDPETFSEVEL